MKTPPSKSRLLIFGGLLALIGLLGAALLVFMIKKDPDEDILTHYQAVAAASQARQYPRPEGEPPLNFEDGPAAPLYREAYDGCLALQANDDDALNESMGRALSAIAPQPDAPALTARPPGWTPPEGCAALGITDEHRDPFIDQLDAPLCLALKDCDGALDALERATRRKDARSPTSIWDPWTGTGNGNMRSMIPFIKLAKLTLIRGQLQARLGDPSARVRSQSAALRHGLDMSHNGGLIGTLIGVSIDRFVIRSLWATLTSCDLTEAEAEAVLNEVNAMRQDPFNLRDAFEGEYLLMTPTLLSNWDGLDVPVTAMPNIAPPGIIDRIVLNDHARNHLQTWTEILNSADHPYRHRKAQREALLNAMNQKLNPMTQIGLPNYTKYDDEITLANLRLDVLAALASAHLHGLRSGAPPNPEQLGVLLNGSLPEDHFTGGLMIVKLDGATLTVEADALTQQPELFSDDQDRAHGLRFQLQVPNPACPAPEPTPEAPAP